MKVITRGELTNNGNKMNRQQKILNKILKHDLVTEWAISRMYVVRNDPWTKYIAEGYQTYGFLVMHRFLVSESLFGRLYHKLLWKSFLFLNNSRNRFCNFISNLWVSSRDKSPSFRNLVVSSKIIAIIVI